MTHFWLRRERDPSGVSGLGRVAEGVEFSDGRCVLRWLGPISSMGIYASAADVVAVHGHEGATVIEWDLDRGPTCPLCGERMRTCCDSAIGLDHQSRCATGASMASAWTH